MLLGFKAKVLTTPVKIIAVLFVLFIFIVLVYAYVFSKNPILSSSIGKILQKGLTLDILDRGGKDIVSLKSNPQKYQLNNAIIKDKTPDKLIEAVLSLNYILDGNRKECSPLNVQKQLANNCRYTSAIIVANNYILHSSLNNDEDSSGLLFRLRKFIIIHSLNKNFTQNSFFDFLLNYSYFGNNIIGVKTAAKKYFGVLSLKFLHVRQMAYLVKSIYENNSYIYDNSNNKNITVNNILKAMYEIGYINAKQFSKAENQNLSVKTVKNGLYQMYANQIISHALPYSFKTNNIKVLSTLDASIQKNSSEYLHDFLVKSSVPSASLFIVNNGEIVTGFTEKVVGSSKTKFINKFPDVRAQNLLRSFFYLGLLKQKVSIPSEILSKEVQNIIVEHYLSPNNLDTKLFPHFSKSLLGDNQGKKTKDIIALNNAASQIANAEQRLFSKLNDNTIQFLLNNLNVSKQNFEHNISFSYINTNLANVTNAFASLNQYGISYLNPVVMTNVYTDSIPAPKHKFNHLNKDWIKIVMDKTTRLATNGNNLYRVIYDNNLAIIYYKGYTIGVWLGDLNKNPNTNYESNYYSQLETIVPKLVSIISISPNIITKHVPATSNDTNTLSNQETVAQPQNEETQSQPATTQPTQPVAQPQNNIPNTATVKKTSPVLAPNEMKKNNNALNLEKY